MKFLNTIFPQFPDVKIQKCWNDFRKFFEKWPPFDTGNAWNRTCRMLMRQADTCAAIRAERRRKAVVHGLLLARVRSTGDKRVRGGLDGGEKDKRKDYGACGRLINDWGLQRRAALSMRVVDRVKNIFGAVETRFAMIRNSFAPLVIFYIVSIYVDSGNQRNWRNFWIASNQAEPSHAKSK